MRGGICFFKRFGIFVGVAMSLVAWMMAGCARSLPPEIPDFKPPAARKPAPAVPPPTAKEAKPVAEAPPAPVQAPVPQAPQTQPAAPPQIKPVAAPAAKAPTIVGTWQVVEMSQNGQAQPLPPGASVTLTFAEGGTVSMTMGGGPEGGQSRQGTYSVSGNSITIAMENESKTGTLTFEGNDRAIIEVEEMRMTLTRAAG